jgi:hypothetical protein
MISSKVWSVIRDIKNIYGFKFVLFGDFYQLPSVEANHYDMVNSENEHISNGVLKNEFSSVPYQT